MVGADERKAYLTQNQGVPSSQFLVQAQAGTEPFVGAYGFFLNSLMQITLAWCRQRHALDVVVFYFDKFVGMTLIRKYGIVRVNEETDNQHSFRVSTGRELCIVVV
jgi:hypothetical protein